ncbi:MAG: amidohydrolase family protein [Deinococcus sp.]|nr:amidohydrolase family protein [Deinococcus sp.]
MAEGKSRATASTGTLLLSDFVLARDGVHASWGVRLVGDRIDKVGPARELLKQYPSDAVWDASGKAIVPGLVNTHMHLYGLLSHGIPMSGAPSDFWAFLKEFWWPRIEDRLDHALIQASTAWACLEMLKSGITTFCDVLEAPHALPGALEAEAEVVRRFGLRALLCFEATERVSQANGQLGLVENANFIDACQKRHDLIGGLMCIHTTFTCSAPFIQQADALARARGALHHMHLSESKYEGDYCRQHFGEGPVARYQRLGILGPHILASQCVQVDQLERRILAEHGVRVSSMPLSNCEVGGGFAPVPEYLELGMTVSLGTDGYVNNFFEVMRGAFLMHKARLESPQVLPAKVVWHLATRGGALALGLEHTGEIAPGRSADLVLMDLDLPTPLTEGNLLDQLLLFRNPGNVDAVLVAGRPLMKHKQLLIDVDPEAIRARAHEATRRLWGV